MERPGLELTLMRDVCLLLGASGGNCAVAEDQVDYGTATAIEIYRASENQPINAGTVIGCIAGGHQIGSGRR
jgi:hypothetical protein